MKAFALTPSLAVAGQILPEHVPAIAEAGFKVIINNRPDGEEPGQPSSDDVASAAKAQGLEYRHLPVNAMNFPGPDLEVMKHLFDDESQSVFAFCRTGTRCANLWIYSREDADVDEARQQAASIGFDISMSARR